MFYILLIVGRNHGILTVGPSVAFAFDNMYYLERVCQFQVLTSMVTRNNPCPMSPEVAQRTSDHYWEPNYMDKYAEAHLDSFREMFGFKTDP